MKPIEPIVIETPLETIGETVREKVIIEDRIFYITHPIDSDPILRHPDILAARKADDYMPYWTDIWPASRMMAKAILRETWSDYAFAASGKWEALEIGCGLGVAGLAALSIGMQVIFSDYDLTALHFVERNARQNGFKDFRLLPLDWRSPPEDLKVPVILASDVMYETRNIEPILALIQQVLLPDGVVFLTDQDRPPSSMFRQRLGELGFTYTKEMLRAGEPGGPRVKGTLYRIRHKSSR